MIRITTFLCVLCTCSFTEALEGVTDLHATQTMSSRVEGLQCEVNTSEAESSSIFSRRVELPPSRPGGPVSFEEWCGGSMTSVQDDNSIETSMDGVDLSVIAKGEHRFSNHRLSQSLVTEVRMEVPGSRVPIRIGGSGSTSLSGNFITRKANPGQLPVLHLYAEWREGRTQYTDLWNNTTLSLYDATMGELLFQETMPNDLWVVGKQFDWSGRDGHEVRFEFDGQFSFEGYTGRRQSYVDLVGAAWYLVPEPSPCVLLPLASGMIVFRRRRAFATYVV